jgi:peptidase E
MYDATMKNSYFLLTSNESIGVGGGQGFALLLVCAEDHNIIFDL